MLYQFLTTAALATMTISTLSCSNAKTSTLENASWPSTNEIMVVAHRGCWRLAPENSVAAIEECIKIGAHMVEIDVRRSKDGELVLMHDATVDRTTTGSGNVSTLNSQDLYQLTLREGLGGEAAQLSQQYVPSLRDALQAAKGKILINLDAKNDIRSDAVAIAKELGMESQILIKKRISSPEELDPSTLALSQSISFMPIIKAKYGDMAAQINRFKHSKQPAFELIYFTEDGLKSACHAAAQLQQRCWVNTMWERLSPGHHDDIAYQNPEQHWGRLIELGVNMIQTDRPVELLEYLSKR